jgi:hypothetical protein
MGERIFVDTAETILGLPPGTRTSPIYTLDCPVHHRPMWWDAGEPAWYCPDCGWRDMGEETRMVVPGVWVPVEPDERDGGGS